MAGPIVFPYSVFPLTEMGDSLWSDALQAWLISGYSRARPILDELGEYAVASNVKLAIEPVDHWETPAPNSVTDVMDFLEGVGSRQVGVCIDSAHVMLAGGGPAAFAAEVGRAAEQDRLHYVHISPPDRGALHESWIPWKEFLEPIVANYDGPLLLETFNAVAPFVSSLRLTRRKFWIPGEDHEDARVPDAYTIAREAIAAVRQELTKLEGVEKLSGARELA
jgi:sugar phosphate isomerase/epimerase